MPLVLLVGLAIVGIGVAVAAASARSSERRAARPAGAAQRGVRAQQRGLRVAAWPRAGMFAPHVWTPPRTARPREAYLHAWDGTYAVRLATGDWLFYRGSGPVGATWEREDRSGAAELALIFLELSHDSNPLWPKAYPQALQDKFFDLGVAFGITELVLAAADGENPNPAIFEKMRGEQAARQAQVRDLVDRAAENFTSLNWVGFFGNWLELFTTFYDILKNDVDWSFESHGAGPTLHLAFGAWTPLVAERLANEGMLALRASGRPVARVVRAQQRGLR